MTGVSDRYPKGEDAPSLTHALPVVIISTDSLSEWRGGFGRSSRLERARASSRGNAHTLLVNDAKTTQAETLHGWQKRSRRLRGYRKQASRP